MRQVHQTTQKLITTAGVSNVIVLPNNPQAKYQEDIRKRRTIYNFAQILSAWAFI